MLAQEREGREEIGLEEIKVGMTKRFLESVAEELGTCDISDPRVVKEATRRWEKMLEELRREEAEKGQN